MGEYAEMEIFAQMRGKHTSDLSIGEFREFYQEYDNKPATKRREPVLCKVCGKRIKHVKGLPQHMADAHGIKS